MQHIFDEWGKQFDFSCMFHAYLEWHMLCAVLVDGPDVNIILRILHSDD